MIRPVEERDLGAITRIYNQAAHVNLELAPVSQGNRTNWIKEHRDPITAWAYELSDRDVIGYCGLSPLSFRCGYQRVAEICLYVDRFETARVNRIGAALLVHLVDEARRLGLRSLFAHVLSCNLPAIGGCITYGFKPVATLREGARLPEGWVDCLWMQKDLNEPDPPPYRSLKRS
jgi:L-amino acid N-acyltransferase YncA